MKKLVVLGGGISGYGSAILARRKGFDVFLSDSGRIAGFLNCASATVYTYRTKLRNAALDRDDFESQVARIGL